MFNSILKNQNNLFRKIIFFFSYFCFSGIENKHEIYASCQIPAGLPALSTISSTSSVIKPRNRILAGSNSPVNSSKAASAAVVSSSTKPISETTPKTVSPKPKALPPLTPQAIAKTSPVNPSPGRPLVVTSRLFGPKLKNELDPCVCPPTGNSISSINNTQPIVRPQAATSKIFAPRTEDMNKGYLMFSDEEPGLTSK